MSRTQIVLTLSLLFGIAGLSSAGPKEDVAAATQAWAEAFNSRDPERVLALYDSDAVLWGTVSPTLRDTRDGLREYFKVLPSSPQGRVSFGEQRIRVYGDVAISSGYYTFSNVRDGQTMTFPARFSFTYRQRDGRWLIVDHHSSMIPKPPAQ